MFEVVLLLCAKFFRRVWSVTWHTWQSPNKWMIFGTRAVQSLQLSQNLMLSKHYTAGWSVDMFSGASEPSEICEEVCQWEERKAVKLYSCSIALTLFKIAGRSKVQTLLKWSKIQVLSALKILLGENISAVFFMPHLTLVSLPQNWGGGRFFELYLLEDFMITFISELLVVFDAFCSWKTSKFSFPLSCSNFLPGQKRSWKRLFFFLPRTTGNLHNHVWCPDRNKLRLPSPASLKRRKGRAAAHEPRVVYRQGWLAG